MFEIAVEFIRETSRFSEKKKVVRKYPDHNGHSSSLPDPLTVNFLNYSCMNFRDQQKAATPPLILDAVFFCGERRADGEQQKRVCGCKCSQIQSLQQSRTTVQWRQDDGQKRRTNGRMYGRHSGEMKQREREREKKLVGREKELRNNNEHQKAERQMVVCQKGYKAMLM